MNTTPEIDRLSKELSEPFDPSEVKFKPAVVSGNRAMAIAYVDARVVQDRLDDVLGVLNWQDEYETLPNGSVVCRLRLRIGGEWITKTDVGGESEQPDEGDRRKAAFSDALKRAAVKWGIGRYLYRLPTIWADYDPQHRRFVRSPTLPTSACSEGKPASKPQKQQAPQGHSAATRPYGERFVENLAAKDKEFAQKGWMVAGDLIGHIKDFARKKKFPEDMKTWTVEQGNRAVEEIQRLRGDFEKRPQAGLKEIPANGAELQRRLLNFQDGLVKAGKCKPGQLLDHIRHRGEEAGYGTDLTAWTSDAIDASVQWVRDFTNPPAREDGEIIGEKERTEVPALMKRAGRVWSQCLTLLRLPSETRVMDLTWGDFKRLKAKLEEEAKQKARAS